MAKDDEAPDEDAGSPHGRVKTDEDRARIWEVRRYCQIKPSLVQYDREAVVGDSPDSGAAQVAGRSASEDPNTDAALSALLRCLLYEIDAEIAMISLLDDETQYFLAGAARDSLESAEVTLESTRWFGCDSVLQHGGLCEKTVTMRGMPAIYEELDLTKGETTKHLPFVDGTIARFKHYAGSPVVTDDGIVLGTVFTFSSKPSTGISARQRKFLSETSKHITHQLVQAVRALEGLRATTYSTSLGTLLDSATSCIAKFDQDPHASDPDDTGQFAPFVRQIYQRGAELLIKAFGLHGCRFQQPSSEGQISTPGKEEDAVIAQATGGNPSTALDVDRSTMEHLITTYPQGAIFHLFGQSDGGGFLSATGDGQGLLEANANAGLRRALPDAKQILYMPLWDSFHNRTVAAAFGWSTSFDRVYASKTDLSQLSAFCTCVMAQVLRMESHVLDQTKADFLGSISHEMRSPLHGTLGSLELLTGTKCSPEQLDLMQSALSGGTQLLDTIDKILHFTKISSAQDGSEHGRPDSISSSVIPKADESGEVALWDLCDQVIGEVARRTQTIDLMAPRAAEDGQANKTHPVVITLDAAPETNIRLTNHRSFGLVLENLLTNALKYSGVDCCMRTTIALDDDNLTATVADCGRGISRDFLRNSLFVPFSQARPIDAGTGLGLPLVKKTVEALKGTMRIESEEGLGTIAEAVIPVASLTKQTDASVKRACRLTPPESPTLPSPLQAQIFIPPVWASGIYGKKGDRLVDNLFSSLERNLNIWTSTKLSKWDTEAKLPDVIFIRRGDCRDFIERCGESHKDVKKVFIGSEVQAGKPAVSEIETPTAGSGSEVEILGPILPSKLGEALDTVFRTSHRPPPLEEETPGSNEGDSAVDGLGSASKETEAGSSSRSSQNDEGNASESESAPAAAQSAIPPHSAQSEDPSPKDSPEPRLLLVDDNAVNLKLLKMFVQKSGVKDAVAVPGGQEALAAYDRILDGEAPFSICFMDLSMPEVDGFEATAGIRQREAEHGRERMLIVALTGLVSGKDRAAAVKAGADGYMTKPAKVKDVKDVIERWKE